MLKSSNKTCLKCKYQLIKREKQKRNNFATDLHSLKGMFEVSKP